MNKLEIIKKQREMQAALQEDVKKNLIEIRGQFVILDSGIAKLYGVETRALNQAVKRNAEKFPPDYMFRLNKQEVVNLQSQNVITNISSKSRALPAAFTEKGLYMLATTLKSPIATAVTFAIIETFAAVRTLKRELLELHQEKDSKTQQSKMEHFGKVLTDIVMPDFETTETESTLEINFIIGKLKHTVKRIKRNDEQDGADD